MKKVPPIDENRADSRSLPHDILVTLEGNCGVCVVQWSDKIESYIVTFKPKWFNALHKDYSSAIEQAKELVTNGVQK